MVLNNGGTAQESALEPDIALIGAQIRSLRKIKGLTLQQVADEAGISAGHLSQIERSKAKLQIAVLKRIATVLEVQISWFFQPEALGPPEERGIVVRSGHRRKMSAAETGIGEELLSPHLDGPVEMLLSTISPGADSGFYSHNGDEAGFVLEGVLQLWVGEKMFELSAGDSFSFKSSQPHRCANPSNQPTKVVWVITPPHY